LPHQSLLKIVNEKGHGLTLINTVYPVIMSNIQPLINADKRGKKNHKSTIENLSLQLRSGQALSGVEGTHSVLSIAYCVLRTAYCVLRIAYCVLHTAYCVWRIMNCVLRICHFDQIAAYPPSVISTGVMRSITKWRNLFKHCHSCPASKCGINSVRNPCSCHYERSVAQ